MSQSPDFPPDKVRAGRLLARGIEAVAHIVTSRFAPAEAQARWPLFVNAGITLLEASRSGTLFGDFERRAHANAVLELLRLAVCFAQTELERRACRILPVLLMIVTVKTYHVETSLWGNLSLVDFVERALVFADETRQWEADLRLAPLGRA